MKFTTPRFLTVLAGTVFVGFVIVAGMRALGIIQLGGNADDPAVLAQTARDALVAVKERTPDDRRPASYDAVLAPLDQLLGQAKALVESEEFDPVGEYEKLRSITLPVIEIATEADTAAREETAFLSKEYRFNEQKGDACRYLANGLWEKILRELPKQTGFFEESVRYPPKEMEEMRRIVDTGIAAAPENPELYYIRGVVNRAEGLFGPAARDLESAVEFRAAYAAAWNTLGLVRINLREFDKAEEALERSRELETEIAQRAGAPLGSEYTAIIYNLAIFHEGLASFYSREYRVTPTVESQALMQRHSAAARKYLEEFLSRESPDSADAGMARAKLDALP